MIRFIEVFWGPITILVCTIGVFYGFSWILEKFAEWLGFDNDEDW